MRMDSAVSTAARALSVGNPLEALKHVALRNDAPALALRGIAMAQFGEFSRARVLLRRAASTFGAAAPVSRARCIVAQAEIALLMRDLVGAARGLDDAVRLLTRRGDAGNAAFARLVQVRRLALLGQVDAASRTLAKLDSSGAPARFVALASLASADLAMKRGDSEAAMHALARARVAALAASIPTLSSEVEHAYEQLRAPVARLLSAGRERRLVLSDLPSVFASRDLVIDACRREARLGSDVVSLVRRPTLLELLVALGERAPRDVPRDELILRVFGARRVNESHRVRLRVEVGRLRKQLSPFAQLTATAAGYALVPRRGAEVAVLLPPAKGEASALLALLQSGDAWATSALSEAVGKSQRAVQRALSGLELAGKVRASGKGRARRWVATPAAGFATTLLLVARGTLS